MSYRDPMEALLARQRKLEEEVDATKEALAKSEAENSHLRAERERAEASANNDAPGESNPAPAMEEDTRPLPSKRFTLVAYTLAVSSALAGLLAGMFAPALWMGLAPLYILTLGISLAHLRRLPSASNGLWYYGFMTLLGLVPCGGLFAPLPCIMILGEYKRETTWPYLLTTLAMCTTQIWFAIGSKVVWGH